MSDEDLALAVRGKRDQEAFAAIYDRHGRLAVATAYRVLNDRRLAEDAVHDAFLSLWQRPERFDPEKGKLKSWLLMVVRHRAIDIARKRSNAKTEPYSAEMEQLPTASAFEDALDAMARDDIQEAVNALPADQMETISMAYFGGYTNNEIAQIKNVPLGTVKGRIRLGMVKLREYLRVKSEGYSD